jgi:hypothetical protein
MDCTHEHLIPVESGGLSMQAGELIDTRQAEYYCPDCKVWNPELDPVANQSGEPEIIPI